MKPETLSRNMIDAGAEIEKPMVLIDRLTELVIARAKELVPVKTGFLRDSIQRRDIGVQTLVEATAPYAPFVESRHPFLGPAIEQIQAQLEQEVGYFGQIVMDKAAKG